MQHLIQILAAAFHRRGGPVVLAEDYARNPNRLPTVKPTREEWVNLVTIVVTDIGETNAVAIMVAALGEARAKRLIDDKQGPALTRRDNHAIIRALYPYIPPVDGSREAKIDWAIAKGRAAFASDERFSEVLAYVLDRVKEFEDAGGSIDKYPDPPQTDPVIVPENDIDLSAAEWIGPSGRLAATVETLADLRIDAEKIYYRLSPGTELWQPYSDDCNQYACFFVERDGKFKGGKFEWSSYSRNWRHTKNIKTGYADGLVPVSGETVWFCFISLDGSKRTNCLAVTWP